MYAKIIAFIFLFTNSMANAQEPAVRERLSIAGTWKFKLDSSGMGLQNTWQDNIFTDECELPGSLEENGKGNLVKQTTSAHLNQTWEYIGVAWFQKEIEIPASWNDKQLELFLERTKATRVWIDHQLIGQSSLLSTPQIYNLTGKLTPGKHLLTLLVDNSPELLPVGGSHALSEHTQTNWNGVLGKMYLEAADKLKINKIRIIPDSGKKVIEVQLHLLNNLHAEKQVVIELQASSVNAHENHTVKPKRFKLVMNKDTLVQLPYSLGEKALLWNEYTPVFYELEVNLLVEDCIIDHNSTTFGLCEFKQKGTQFSVNRAVTFLRGKNDGSISPLTGYPPMDIDGWRKIYRTAKEYGINHYRFHSYTPPEAAFEAADMEGIYLQAELPNWANLMERDTFRTEFQHSEGKAILDSYGHHPSFVMFSLGNELGGDSAIHNKLVRDFRKSDRQKLYAYGTNAFYNDPKPGKTDDFWVTMRTGKESPTGKFDVRGSFATTEDAGNGIINSMEPSTRRNFFSAIKDIDLPVIGHEIGQYQIYPDYKEIPRYTGILRPSNLEIFKQRLQKAGMGDQAEDFSKASGMLTALLYREEIEMALRTPGLAGFQLLDLQDYTGQGTALVGLLNAFMESKGLVSPDEFRRFSNDVVLQLLMDKYVWTNDETYFADVQLVNYSPQNITDEKLVWRIMDDKGNRKIAGGILPVRLAKKGKINTLDRIYFPLHNISKALKLMVHLEIPGTVYSIDYPVWIYPKKIDIKGPEGVTIAAKLDEKVFKTLENGGSVLLFPDYDSVKDKTVPPQFISEFWNWLVFKSAAENMKRPVSAGTLGMLINPEHPLFNSFPTDSYTNWQWWDIAKNARPLILDKTEKDYRPIVQVIDNIDRNHKLGMIFEFKVSKGKLLVCMANLPNLVYRPEARQLYHSIIYYMKSGKFNPVKSIDRNQLNELL